MIIFSALTISLIKKSKLSHSSIELFYFRFTILYLFSEIFHGYYFQHFNESDFPQKSDLDMCIFSLTVKKLCVANRFLLKTFD